VCLVVRVRQREGERQREIEIGDRERERLNCLVPTDNEGKRRGKMMVQTTGK
jgi:hypothetical protein